MTHTYNISGMTCTGCQAKVHVLLSKIPYVTNVEISLAEGTADISMSEHIATPTLQDALKDYPKYQLTENAHAHHAAPAFTDASEEQRTWIETYKPILIIFAYITVIALLAATAGNTFNWMKGMSVFMGGFSSHSRSLKCLTCRLLPIVMRCTILLPKNSGDGVLSMPLSNCFWVSLLLLILNRW
jgi:copper chaperone CopZ